MKCSKKRLARRKAPARRRPAIETLEARQLLASVWQNPWNRLDVDNDGAVLPLDAFLTINLLISDDSPTLPPPPAVPPPYYDTDGNGSLGHLDAFLIINALIGDVDPPELSAGLFRDSAPLGATNADGVTLNPTIAGTAVDLTGISILAASVNGSELIEVPVAPGGAFTFDPGLATDGSDDGPHVVQFVALDGVGNATPVVTVNFVLDSQLPSSLSFDLAPGSDTPPLGDGQTEQNPVNLAGQTEAGMLLQLLDSGGAPLATTTAAGDGSFQFVDVELADGNNTFTVAAWDPAGNRRDTPRTIEYLSGDPVIFTDADLEAAVRAELRLPDTSLITTGNILGLRQLTADSNQIDNLTGLEFATNLRSLELVPSDYGLPGSLAGLAPLNGLANLQSVSLIGLQLDDADLAAFAPSGPLAAFDLRYNDVTSLDFLAGWDDLADFKVFFNPLNDLSALVGRALNTDLAPVGLELATTVPEVVAALHGLSLDLFEYVANRFPYQPYGGSMKGSQAVLETGTANDWDQSRLLVDLLAEAGVNARFRHGQIEAPTEVVLDWLSVTDTDAAGLVLANADLNPIEILAPGPVSVAYRFDHTWVEAELFVPGVGLTWVPLDPSWKFKDHQPGIPDLLTSVPFDSAGYLAEVRKELASEYYANQVSEYLEGLGTGQALTDVPYDGPIIPQVVTAAPTALPYDVLGTPDTHAAIPLSMTHRVQVQVYLGAALKIDHLLVLPEMGLQRVTIGFATAPANQVIPELRLEGDIAATGTAGSRFSNVTIVLNHFDAGDDFLDSSFSYGRETSDYIAVGLDANQISDQLITRQLEAATNASFAHLNGEAVDRDEEIGALLGAAILRYFQRTDEGEQLVDRLTHAATLYSRVASGLATSDTTVSYFPELNLPFVPDSINVDVANLYHQSFPIDGDPTGDEIRELIRNYNGSAQEHAVWEELLNTTSISTIKSLQLANERGIPIFVIDSGNAGTLLPQLTHSGFTTSAIADEVADGATVTVPRDPTNLQDWDGVGYITERPGGSIGFIISGGLAGQTAAIMRGGSGTGDPNDPNTPDRDPNQRDAGDPINIANGNVLRDDRDILLPMPGIPLELNRHYDSHNTLDIGFGPGWVFTFSDFLQITPGGPITWQSSDGFPFTFVPDGGGGYTAPPSLRGSFTAFAGGFRFRRRDGMEHEFNTAGRLVAVRDRNGNAVLLTYDGDGHLETASDADAPSRKLTYNWTGGHITSVSDHTGRTWTYAYTAGRLTSVTTPSDGDAAAAVTRYEYYTDAAREDLLKTIIQPDGGRISYTYYANRRGFQETDPEGFRQTFYYDLDRRETTFVDERGFRTVYAYDDRGQLLTLEYADGATERRTWEDGLVVARTDGVGRSTLFTYDALGNVLTETDRAGQATTYTYEPLFNMVATRTEPGGRTTAFDYDAFGNWTEMTDPNGNVRTRTYNGRGLVLTETDGRGNTVTFAYNAAGQPTSITTTLPSTETKTYDARGNLLSMTDRNGHATTYTYDIRDRKLTETNALGGVTSFRYDVMHNVIRETDELGRVREFDYDLRQLATRVTFPDGTTQDSAYDGTRHKTRTVDELGRVTRYTFDSRGRMSAMIRPDGTSQQMVYDKNGRLIRLRDERGFLTRYEYDPRDKFARQIDPLGGIQSWTYDAAGNIKTHTDEEGRTTTFNYDLNDNILSTVDPLGGVTQYQYDANNNITRITDKRGHATQFAFDVLNRRTSSTNSLGGVRTTAYDAVGNVTAVGDELGRITTFSYDNLNRRTAVTDPRGNAALYAYDAVDNLVSLTDARGGVTTYTYDILNHLVREVDPHGKAIRRTYDAVGMVISETDELNRTTTFAYDTRARLVETRDPLGNVWRTTYDGVGNVTAVIDPLGHRDDHAYDALRRRTSHEDPRGGVTQFQYDDVGNLTSLTDPEGNTTTYVYDDLNRLVTETNDLGQSRTHVYDANDNLIRTDDRNGRRTTYTYDNLNRQTTEQWSSGGPILRTFTWVYDAAGQVTSVGDGQSQYAFSFDLAGNPTSVSNAGTAGVPAVVIAQTYDDENNRLTRTDTVAGAASATTSYVYDALQRLTRVSQSGPQAAAKRIDLAYDAAGQLVGIQRFADSGGSLPVAQSTITFDRNGRLTGLVHRDDALEISRYSWQFDAANRIVRAVTPDGITNYAYDAQNQLLSAQHSVLSDETYAYDDNGNRASGGYVVGADNRLQADATFDYQYDAEGNRTRRTHRATGAVTEYEWDHRNRLVRVTERASAAGPVTRESLYGYDAFDRRIAKSVDPDGAGAAASDTTRFVYDGDHVAYVFDGAGNRLNLFVHGPGWDRVLADEQPGGVVLWPLADNLGSIRQLVDSSGAVVNEVVYDSFGRIVAWSNPAVDQLFAYTGQQFDAETDLHYYKARYYDAAVGQFLSEDSVGFTDDRFHLRLYVGNNPITQIDPTGHFIESGWDFASLMVGAYSLGSNLAQGNWGEAALDGLGVVADAGALLVPGCPGGAGMAIKALRGAEKLDNAINMARAGQELYDTGSRVLSGNGDKEGIGFSDAANLARLLAGAAGTKFKSKCFVAGTQVIVECVEPASEAASAEAAQPAGPTFASAELLLAGAAAAVIVAGADHQRRRRKSRRRARHEYAQAVDQLLTGDSTEQLWDLPAPAEEESAAASIPAASAPSKLPASVNDRSAPGTLQRTDRSKWRAEPETAAKSRGWLLAGVSLALGLLLCIGLRATQRVTMTDASRAPEISLAKHSPVEPWASKAIEDIQVGDRVLTRDPVTQELGYRRVVQVFHRTSDHLRIVEVDDAATGRQRFETTDEHPFWVAGAGFVEAGQLVPGQELESPDGTRQTVVHTERIEQPLGVPVFNFEVEDWHTYYVRAHGSQGPPILVHNADCGGGDLGPSPRTPVGRSGQQNHWPNPNAPAPRNAPTNIGGRDYSGHAVDRMQERGYVPSVVENAIQHGTPSPGNRPGTTVFTDTANNLRAVVDSASGRVITVIPGQ